ncbi:MAG: hypothetical protein L3J97_04105, partial [Thermoplasmata archaeon]|nr:hypothetical protein [Thermoplasmata archaeon]
IVLGIAMTEARPFAKTFGGLSAVIGVAGLFGVALFAVTSATFAIFGLLTFVVFPLAMGWKVYSLSKEPEPTASPSIAGTG